MNSPAPSAPNDSVRLRGRVLCLSARPDIVRAQLAGRDLTLVPARAPRHRIHAGAVDALRSRRVVSPCDAHIDCAQLTPMVARPGDPGNALPLSQLDENVTLDIALGGSCTAGKRADFDAYHEVLKWAVDHRMRVWARTRMYLQYGTRGVRDLRRLASFGELQEQVANGRVR